MSVGPGLCAGPVGVTIGLQGILEAASIATGRSIGSSWCGIVRLA